MTTDIAIARSVALRPIARVADALGIPDDAVEPYGRFKAKIALDWLEAHGRREGARRGRLVLVTAINMDLGGRIWWPSKLDTEDRSLTANEVAAAMETVH